MGIINGVDTRTRERVLTEDPTEQREFAKEVNRTPIGQRFLAEFENSDENLRRVVETAQKLNPGVPHITLSMYLDALETAIYRGKLQKRPTAHVVPAEVPAEVSTDKNGKRLGPSQLAWKEHAEWARTATSEQIRKRKEIDPSFRAFVQNSIRLEMNQPVDAAPSASIQPVRAATGEDMRSELGAFAAAYQKASTSRLRPIGGFYKLSFPDATGNVVEHSYSPSEWEVLITEAAKISLL
jgi:hypothetical protein